MPSRGNWFLAYLMALLLVLAPVVSQPALADTGRQPQAPRHVVSSADLQKDIDACAQTRQSDEKAIGDFLATPQAQKTLKKAGMDYEVVQRAVPFLSSDELANLAARANHAQRQFEAGALTNQELTYIIIALATAVIVIILVEK